MWRYDLLIALVGCVAGCGLSVKGKPRPAPVEEPAVATSTPAPVSRPDASPQEVDAGEDPSARASIGDYCKKCASCIAADDKFEEGFCDKHKKGSSFDTAECTAQNDGSDLGTLVTKGVLNGWSCSQFDDAQ